MPRCLIGIEAGMATHYVARELVALGHDVRQNEASILAQVRELTACGAQLTTTRG